MKLQVVDYPFGILYYPSMQDLSPDVSTKRNALSQRLSQAISDSRLFLMGIAIILIVLYHWELVCHYNSFILRNGHLGVELFFFVSGFGIYHSLTRETSIKSYYFRRFWRVMPTTIIAGILLLGLWHHGRPETYSFSDFYPYLAFIGMDAWYIRTLAIFYLVSPYLYIWLNKTRYPLISICLYSVFAFILISPWNPYGISQFFSGNTWEPNFFFWHPTIIWTIKRFVAFYIGMYVAHAAAAGSNLRLLGALAILSGALVFLNTVFYPEQESLRKTAEIFMFPCWCFILYGIALLEKHVPRAVATGVRWMGKYSLEIYLVHCAVFANAPSKPWCFPIVLLFSLMGALLINRLASFAVSCVRGK